MPPASISATVAPAEASLRATVIPAGPAPTTQTSKVCSKAVRSVVAASAIIGSPPGRHLSRPAPRASMVRRSAEAEARCLQPTRVRREAKPHFERAGLEHRPQILPEDREIVAAELEAHPALGTRRDPGL